MEFIIVFPNLIALIRNHADKVRDILTNITQEDICIFNPNGRPNEKELNIHLIKYLNV